MTQIRALCATLFFLFTSIYSLSSFAQKTLIYTDKDADFKLGMELFAKEKYGAAQKVFQKVIESNQPQTEERVDAEYFAAICALELFNEDAEFLLSQFVEKHSESKHIKMAYFNMGNFQYRKKRFKEAVVYYEKVDPADLNNNQLSEYYFKSGYSYFSKQEYDKAQKLFFGTENFPC